MEGVALDWQDAWYTDLETAYVYLDELERLGKGLRWVMYADGYVRPKTGDVRGSAHSTHMHSVDHVLM